MKFEIDPNELTTDQRAHVAAFITGWPRDMYGKPPGDTVLKVEPSEEQRLDAEQKSDLGPIGDAEQASDLADIPHMQAANLDVIFGTPDVAKGTPPLIPDILSNTVPLDKEGLPWDSRIHASTKMFIADGSWKLRRGVDPAEVATVKAQLKELMAVPTFVSVDDYSPDEVTQALGGIPVPPSPVIIGVGSDGTMGAQIPPAPKSHYLIDQQPVTLTDLIGRMSKAIAENRLTQANVTEICVKHGVSEFHLLSNRPDLLPLIDADMKAMGV